MSLLALADGDLVLEIELSGLRPAQRHGDERSEVVGVVVVDRTDHCPTRRRRRRGESEHRSAASGVPLTSADQRQVSHRQKPRGSGVHRDRCPVYRCCYNRRRRAEHDRREQERNAYPGRGSHGQPFIFLREALLVSSLRGSAAFVMAGGTLQWQADDCNREPRDSDCQSPPQECPRESGILRRDRSLQLQEPRSENIL